MFSINPPLLQALMARNRLLPCSGAGGKLRMVVSEAGEWAPCSVVEDCTVTLRRAQPGPDSSQMWTGSMMLAPANTPVTLLKASSFQLRWGLLQEAVLCPLSRGLARRWETSQRPETLMFPCLQRGIHSPASAQRTTLYAREGCSLFSTHSFVRTLIPSEILGCSCGICHFLEYIKL